MALKITQNFTDKYLAVVALIAVRYSLGKIPRLKLLFNNQPDALIIQIYAVIKLYMFRASSLLIIRSFLLYVRHR